MMLPMLPLIHHLLPLLPNYRLPLLPLPLIHRLLKPMQQRTQRLALKIHYLLLVL
jgi:hypothetical protein